MEVEGGFFTWYYLQQQYHRLEVAATETSRDVWSQP
ncbi:hypothetical protein XENTR_v10013988 [Xenopus tropicalis]|nr:hypothetical protein XENTR_v10013988 [Xenopus tropicalis]